MAKSRPKTTRPAQPGPFDTKEKTMSKTKTTTTGTDDLFRVPHAAEHRTDQDPEQLRETPAKEKPVAAKTRLANKGRRKPTAYYLPMAQVRGQVFLAHGLIFPAAYDSNPSSPIVDVQARVPHGLLLWKEQPPIGKNELLFGLRLTRDEIADAEQHDDTILLPSPLPISRLTEIAVPAASPEEVAKYMRGWIESDVPVPAALFTQAAEVTPASATVDFQMPATKPSSADGSADIQTAIENYDRLMGIFAFMRNAARHHSGRLGLYADYPAQFFHLAARVRKGLDVASVPSVPPSPFLKGIVDDTPPTDAAQAGLWSLLSARGVFIDKARAKPIADGIARSLNTDASIQQAFKLLFDEDYRAAIRLLQKDPISEPAVLLAALYKFSDRQSNDHRNIKQTLHEDWSNVPLVATVLGMLGAYYGYTALDARESRLYAVERRLAASLDQRPPIKFHLESRFERELIEAIYQRAFYHAELDAKTAALFDAIYPKPGPRPPSPRPGYWKDDSYQVGDIWVRAYRMTSLARSLQRIEEFPGTTVDETSVLGQYLMHACIFHAEEYELSRRDGRETVHYRISKQRLLDLLSEEKIRVNLKMLATALDEDAALRK